MKPVGTKPLDGIDFSNLLLGGEWKRGPRDLMNYNGGRGGIKATKATSVSEHKFGGSHAANKGGKRGDAPFGGSHAKGNSMPKDGDDRGGKC